MDPASSPPPRPHASERAALRRRLRRGALPVAVALGLALGEVVLRIGWPQPTFSRLDEMAPRCFREDDVTPYGLLPGARTRITHPEFDTAIAINGEGLRMDREVTPAPPPGKRRLAVIGDSFTFGFGVEAAESFPARLDEQLDGWEVVNLGFAAGFSPDCYYAHLAQRGPDASFRAEVLLVAVFVGNDLTARVETLWPDLDAHGLPARVTTRFTRVDAQHRFRVRNTLLRYRIPLLRESHVFVGLAHLIAGAHPSADEVDYKAAMAAVYTEELYRTPWSSRLEALFADQVRCLEGIARLAGERGQHLLVVVIPDSHQVYANVPEAGTGRVRRMLRARPGPAVPQSKLRSALDQRGIASLDLLPALIAAQDGELYFHVDGHFTAAGHATAARAVRADLTERGWLD